MSATLVLYWPPLLMMAAQLQSNLLPTSSPIYLVSIFSTLFSHKVFKYVLYYIIMFFTDEAERILQCKGRIFCLDDEPGFHRVWLPCEESPGLAMSRAFGDFCIKDFGVISVPEVTKRQITNRDQFIVLATDGVCRFRILILFL